MKLNVLDYFDKIIWTKSYKNSPKFMIACSFEINLEKDEEIVQLKI